MEGETLSKFIQALVMCVSIFPTWLGIAILSFLTILVIFLVMKMIAFVLDLLPW